MSLDLSRLGNVRKCGGKTTARCPACAEDGNDTKGQHLVIMPDGRFGCVVHPGAAGTAHRKRIFALAGDRGSGGQAAGLVRVRRPVEAAGQQAAAGFDGMGRFGRVLQTYARAREEVCDQGEGDEGKEETHTGGVGQNPSNPSNTGSMGRFGRVLQTPARTRGDVETGEGEERKQETHTGGVGPNPSNPSNPSNRTAGDAGPLLPAPAPVARDPALPDAAPLITRAVEMFQGTVRGTRATPHIDPETGYPIIDGAICPF